ncbi:hypothetical protein FGO68_gene16608 [Halteria grandinella]|uniref:Uncharacterized protein n=1 Tax=Halteria grandinella TaxID=5974 RepID=A0A8J8NPA8_HALGN|nr:hypothetical protein FGO68_gene16608 [Halteria grandinella]
MFIWRHAKQQVNAQQQFQRQVTIQKSRSQSHVSSTAAHSRRNSVHLAEEMISAEVKKQVGKESAFLGSLQQMAERVKVYQSYFMAKKPKYIFNKLPQQATPEQMLQSVVHSQKKQVIKHQIVNHFSSVRNSLLVTNQSTDQEPQASQIEDNPYQKPVTYFPGLLSKRDSNQLYNRLINNSISEFSRQKQTDLNRGLNSRQSQRTIHSYKPQKSIQKIAVKPYIRQSTNAGYTELKPVLSEKKIESDSPYRQYLAESEESKPVEIKKLNYHQRRFSAQVVRARNQASQSRNQDIQRQLSQQSSLEVNKPTLKQRRQDSIKRLRETFTDRLKVIRDTYESNQKDLSVKKRTQHMKYKSIEVVPLYSQII